ncbi:MAG TPA: A/G-specific adenine glycosylase [Phycisphaerales bacterium]|nr:A/G-specific adenine glycosylase [Phycisphaerales bacterium]
MPAPVPAPARPPRARPAGARDRALASELSRWFARSARPLPWRTTPRDPYRSLVSELMLQQTQVARVVPSFERFVSRFPTLAHLADADSQEVIALWSGLGYYRRARTLQAAARTLAAPGAPPTLFPTTVPALRALPGIGPYTAGALASIVFGRPEPAVDGNVARVLLRLHARPGPPADPATRRWLWRRAAQLVRAAPDPAAFNEGLMELGALICTPRSPACGSCPIAAACAARRRGAQDSIPAPKPRPVRTQLHCASALITGPAGVLLERRPPRAGLWSDMWQVPTLESAARAPSLRRLAQAVNTAPPTGRAPPPLTFTCTTSSREVHFRVWRLEAPATPRRGQWVAPDALAGLALSSPQRRILASLARRPDTSTP